MLQKSYFTYVLKTGYFLY